MIKTDQQIFIISHGEVISRSCWAPLVVEGRVETSTLGWDLALKSERCASMPMVVGSNHSGGSESTLHSDLLLTARGSSTWALIVVACLLCYPRNTLCSQRLKRGAIQIPKFNIVNHIFAIVRSRPCRVWGPKPDWHLDPCEAMGHLCQDCTLRSVDTAVNESIPGGD
jgi:hypothetical protein